MTATQTANETLQFISMAAMNNIAQAQASREKALGRMTGYFFADSIENLIKAQACEIVWTEIDGYLHNSGTDEQLLADLERIARRYALNTHKINSSSNVAVEMETAIRLEWVEAYNLITTGSVFGR